MESIHCRFARLSDISVDELLHAYGVYVIWSGKSQARPSYIGEGDIWSRLGQHRNRFPRPVDGYATIIGDEYTAATKRNAQIVEAVLLAIGEETDRYAIHNARGGNLVKLDKLFDRHGVVRIYFEGNDPFLEPGTGRPIEGKRTVSITLDDEDNFTVNHPWRLRRLRLPKS
jgi:hypothetical protein